MDELTNKSLIALELCNSVVSPETLLLFVACHVKFDGTLTWLDKFQFNDPLHDVRGVI